MKLKFISSGNPYAFHKADGKLYKVTIHRDDDPQNPRTEWDNACKMFCWHSRYNLGDPSPDYSSKLRRTWEWPDEYKDPATIFEEFGDGIIRPLFLYDHSGLRISLGPFGCPWDSGQVGWIYVSYENALKELWPSHLTEYGDPPSLSKVMDDMEASSLDDANNVPSPEGNTYLRLKALIDRAMEAEVNTYDLYLRGDCYWFEAEVFDEDYPVPVCEEHPDFSLKGSWSTLETCGGFLTDDPETEASDFLLSVLPSPVKDTP